MKLNNEIEIIQLKSFKSSMNEAFIQVIPGLVPHLSVIMDAGS